MYVEGGPISVSAQGAIALNCMGREIDVIQAAGSATAAYTAGQRSAVHAPAWSPDGEQLAFIEENREPNGSETVATSVVVVDPSGGAPTVLATVPTTGATAVASFGPFSLCWLPGGLGIMFTAPDGPATTHIFVVAMQSGVVTRVTSAPNVVDYSVSCSR
jgi:Tol biopolymer transport system component